LTPAFELPPFFELTPALAGGREGIRDAVDWL